MVINEEPLLILRRRTEALKMLTTSLYTLRSYTKKYAYFVLTGVVIVIAGSAYLAHAAQSQESKPVADEALQRYTACVFGKDMINVEDGNATIIDVDEECQQLSLEGKIVEPQENEFAKEIAVILAGHPMERMADAIALQDKKVAGLIVGIARQESQWGVHAPSKGGVDCYNYWGYKSSGTRGQSMGYACFGSPEEAVDVVAKRLDHFVYKTHRDTPAKMVTPWKCGDSCATHSSESVARWVGTVSTYYNKIVALEDDMQHKNVVSKSKLLSMQ